MSFSRTQDLLAQNKREFQCLLKQRENLHQIPPSEKHMKLAALDKAIVHVMNRAGYLAEKQRTETKQDLHPDAIRFFGGNNLQSRM